jgi:hypothetical protein
MDNSDRQREHIERTIARARAGVGERIDELDGEIRQRLDFKSLATEHAPKLIGAGALAGFLAGFGFPKPLRRILAVGIPLAIVAAKVKSSMEERDGA